MVDVKCSHINMQQPRLTVGLTPSFMDTNPPRRLNIPWVRFLAAVTNMKSP